MILPLFVESGIDGRKPIGSMPGVDRLSISEAVREAGEAAALNNVGVFQVETGEALAAIEACQQSIDLHQQLGHQHGVAGATDTLGNAYYRLGDLAAAVSCFQKASALCSELGDRLDMAVVLTHLGDAHRAAADHAAARTVWCTALEILAQMQHRDAEQVRARLRDLGE